MSEWIESLEANARKYKTGCLKNYKPVVIYVPHEKETIHLDGDFTLDQLEGLLNHVKNYQRNKQ